MPDSGAPVEATERNATGEHTHIVSNKYHITATVRTKRLVRFSAVQQERRGTDKARSGARQPLTFRPSSASRDDASVVAAADGESGALEVRLTGNFSCREDDDRKLR